MDVSIPDGTYPSLASGYITRFRVENKTYVAACDNGIRGINVSDTVTAHNNLLSSKLLGGAVLIQAKASD